MVKNTDSFANKAKSEIRDRYDRLAAGRLNKPSQEDTTARKYFWSRKLVEALRLGSFPEGCHLLEIGCNIGAFTFSLAHRGYRVHGMDLSPGAIAVAQQRATELLLTNISFSVGDVEEMKLFPDSYFDGVVSFSTLRYVPNLPCALSEIHRVLKPGGCAVVDFPNRLCPWFYVKQWLGSEQHPYDHWFTRGSLKRQFEQSGFSELRMKEILFTPTVAPDRLLKLFQFADTICERLPLFKHLGGIIIVAGHKT